MNVLITGANGGIGSSIKKVFIEKKHNVIAPDSTELNLLDSNSIEEYFNKNMEKIDIFIHCAGINNPQSFLEIKEENLKNTLEVNTMSCMKIIKRIIPSMEQNRFGRIVLISSLWSKWIKAGRIPYSMSKSSLDALMRGLAVEFGGKNILVNSVLPGFIDTELTRKNLATDVLEEIENRTPLSRLGKPEDIANISYFLASEDNNFITGQSIVVDGGYTL